MSHPFILVFRFPPESPLQSADIEDDPAEALGNPKDNPTADHVVDGNEIGDGIDVFVDTRDPTSAFAMCESMLEGMQLLKTAIVAYRHVDGDTFTVVHPAEYTGQFVI